MNPLLIGALSIPVLLILLFLRVHIGLALYGIGFFGYWAMVGNFSAAAGILATQPYATAANFTLAVLPLFMLMGTFAGHSGFASDAYDSLKPWMGKIRGGLAMSTIGANAMFGAACGSSAAACAVFGKFSIPEMAKQGYDQRLSVGTVTASGVLAMLIPPSVLMIMYGFLTEQSIGSLFIAGIFPGLLLAAIFCIGIVVMTRLNPGLAPQVTASFSWKDRLFSIRKGWGIGVLALIIIGGIYGGILTPEEAGAVGAFAALVIAFILRRLNRQTFWTSLLDAAAMSAMVFFIYSGAVLFGRFLALTGVPRALIGAVETSGLHSMVILVILMVIYLMLGCILDSLGIMTLTLPLVYPLSQAMGWNPIWFAIVLIVNLEAGLLTPPVGVNVFVVAAVAKLPTWQVFRVAMPFFFMMLVGLVILVAFPSITTWLPGVMLR